MKTRFRADQLVFDSGLAESREKAKSLIMAGRVALADASGEAIGKPEKPGQFFPAETRFILLPGKEYASRGAYKLLTILDSLDVTDFVCVDAGASTGGFTDCLLQRGASRVYAIDVGKNQLHEKLRADPRVVNLEGVNIRYADANLVPEKADLVSADLSFISLCLVLPALVRWLKPGGKLALLIKPQFELSPREVNKGVVVKEEYRKKATDKVVAFCENELGLRLKTLLPAQIKGPKGNQEYMALFESA